MWKKLLFFLPEDLRKLVLIISIFTSFPWLLVIFIGAALGGIASSTPMASEEQYEEYIEVARDLGSEYSLELKWEEIIAVHAVLVQQDFSNVKNTDIEDVARRFIREEEESYTIEVSVPIYKDGSSPSVTCGSTSVDAEEGKEVDRYETVSLTCTRIVYVKVHLSEVITSLIAEQSVSLEEAQLIDVFANNLMGANDTPGSTNLMPDWTPVVRELQWPVPDSYRVTSLFGIRKDPINGNQTQHNGLDVGASTGTVIVAVADGTVKSAGYTPITGITVILSHSHGMETRYYHLSRLDVKEKDQIEAGDVIGAVGNTGRSTGAHLHFEVRINGSAVDPLPYYQ